MPECEDLQGQTLGREHVQRLRRPPPSHKTLLETRSLPDLGSAMLREEEVTAEEDLLEDEDREVAFILNECKVRRNPRGVNPCRDQGAKLMEA